MGYPDSPVFQCLEDSFKLPELQISPHCVFHFELFFLLIQLSAEYIEVDGVDDQVLEFADGRHIERL